MRTSAGTWIYPEGPTRRLRLLIPVLSPGECLTSHRPAQAGRIQENPSWYEVQETFYTESLNTSRGGSERMFTGAEHVITKANVVVNQRSGHDGEPG